MILKNLLSKFINQFSNFDANRSKEWSKVRKQHLENYPECQCCGRKDDLDVHHIVPVHVNPSLELNDSNLITLCSKYCHFSIGHLMDWKSWNEDVVLDAAKLNKKIKNRPYHDH